MSIEFGSSVNPLKFLTAVDIRKERIAVLNSGILPLRDLLFISITESKSVFTVL